MSIFASRYTRVLLLVFAAAVLLVLALYLSLRHTDAPAVRYTTLDGQAHQLQEWRGKVVLVNFWATSCTTCVAEMPEMVDTYQKFHGRGLEFVAVAMHYDPPDYVRTFTQTRALPFPVALDADGRIAHAFGEVRLTPTTFLIDREGRVLKRFVGRPDFAALHRVLDALLTAP